MTHAARPMVYLLWAFVYAASEVLIAYGSLHLSSYVPNSSSMAYFLILTFAVTTFITWGAFAAMHRRMAFAWVGAILAHGVTATVAVAMGTPGKPVTIWDEIGLAAMMYLGTAYVPLGGGLVGWYVIGGLRRRSRSPRPIA